MLNMNAMFCVGLGLLIVTLLTRNAWGTHLLLVKAPKDISRTRANIVLGSVLMVVMTTRCMSAMITENL